LGLKGKKNGSNFFGNIILARKNFFLPIGIEGKSQKVITGNKMFGRVITT
jgi:hypothetical protein